MPLLVAQAHARAVPLLRTSNTARAGVPVNPPCPTNASQVFTRLNGMLKTLETIEGIKFAVSPKYGYVTSCPSNLGTGMRASVHIKVPNLTSDGTDKKAKAICKPLGLSVRGTGGEHTPIGADGTIDLSPSARLFITEAQIVSKLYQGIQDLMVEEKKAGGK